MVGVLDDLRVISGQSCLVASGGLEVISFGLYAGLEVQIFGHSEGGGVRLTPVVGLEMGADHDPSSEL